MNLVQAGLNKIAKDFKTTQEAVPRRVIVCAGTGCLVNGSMKVYEEFLRTIAQTGLAIVPELKKEHEGVSVTKSGCQGFCQIGPLVTVLPEGILYTKVKPKDVQDIVETTLKKGKFSIDLSMWNRKQKSSVQLLRRSPSIRNSAASFLIIAVV